jgi:tetratricopeptide (TPR) repeat protein
MIAKVLFSVLLFSTAELYAQKTNSGNQNLSAQTASQVQEDELTEHLSAAETYQISGDLENAAVENKKVAAIALYRLANTAIEEEKFQEAEKLLTESKNFDDNAKTRINLAIVYLRQNQIEKALDEARTAVNLDPKLARARYILGNVYFTKGDYASALPELEKVLTIAPDFDAAHALGLTYLNLKQIERAKLLFEEIQAALKKDSAELHIIFGQSFEKTGYWTEAEREFKRALAIDPKTPKANFFLGYVLLQHAGSERLNDARQAFKRELQLNPNDFYANFFAGVAATSESAHPEAIGYLQRAVRFNPKSAEAHLFLGQSQMELEQLAEAEKNLRRAIELKGNDPKSDYQSRRMHFLLGRLLIKTGRKAEGEKELDKARKLQEKLLESARDEVSQILGQVAGETNNAPSANSADIRKSAEPANVSQTRSISPAKAAEIKKIKLYLSDILAQALHNLGVISAQKGSLDDAVAKFAAAAEWKPDFPGLDRNWGIISFRANQFDKAIAPLSRHVKTSPEDALTRRMLGVSYYFNKNYKLAVETLKPIESDLANDAELAYFYGISLYSQQRNQEASAIFGRISDQNQKTAQARFYAGQGFVLVGDYERAVKEFRAASAIETGFLQAHYNAGQSLIRLNRLDEAEKEFRRELALNPSDEMSKYSIAYTLLERKINTEEALALLREAIFSRSDYADARYQLGKALIEKGEIVEAIEHLETAARSEPKKDYIQYQLSIAYRRASRVADADRALKNFRDLKEANRREKPSGMGNNAN